MTKDRIELSIVIATRNDSDLIGELLDRVSETATKLGCVFEIIVVDAHSTDRTSYIAEQRGAKVLHLPQRPPYGEIVRKGIEQAQGSFIVTLDADLLPDYCIISQFWQRRDRSELLIGSRYIAGGSARMPVARKVLSRALNRFYGVFLSLPFKDISSGFRMHNTKIFEDVRLDSSDYSILIELILKAYANGWVVEEAPFRFEPEKFGNSTKRAFSFLLTYLKSLFRMWQLRNSVFSADYDERAYDSIIPLQRYWQRARYRIIMSFIEGGNTILDIGCGSSRIIQQFPGAVGLDISLKKLRYLRGRGIRLSRADINRLPFKHDSFSLVICSQVIEHVPPAPEIYTEINRVMQSGGTLVIGTPDYGRLRWRVIEFFYKKLLPGAYAEQHITHYTRESLGKILQQNGFEILKQRYVGGSELIIKAKKVTNVASVPSALGSRDS
ncbi:MAG: methyltransferase domain-containing protein [Candidatus Hydrogenedentota bacterium]|nr:MAG: methyltransferase domain-containing protein [Candidatus Hydrogenedentota bacterium]